MSISPYWRPTPEEIDEQMVRYGFMTEEERIAAAYRRIFKRALERRKPALPIG